MGDYQSEVEPISELRQLKSDSGVSMRGIEFTDVVKPIPTPTLSTEEMETQ
jgi:hypothetical protein